MVISFNLKRLNCNSTSSSFHGPARKPNWIPVYVSLQFTLILMWTFAESEGRHGVVTMRIKNPEAF